MARVVKQAEVRRSELLECARTLFFERGFAATTVAEIIERAGVSKGGFYHHFESKDVLFEALIERIALDAVEETRVLLRGAELDPLKQLNAFLAHGRDWKLAASPYLRELVSVAVRADDGVLYQRLTAATARVVAPLLIEIIDEGIRRDVFSAPDSGLVVDVLLHLAHTRRAIVAAAIADLDRGAIGEAADRIERRMHAEALTLDRVLGVPAGSVRIGEPGFVREILEAMIA